MKEKTSNIFKKFYNSFVDAFRGIYVHIPITFFVIIIFNIAIHILSYVSEHHQSGESYVFESFVQYMAVFAAFWALGTFFTEIAVGKNVSSNNLTKKHINDKNQIEDISKKPVKKNKVVFKIIGTVASALASLFITYKLLGYFLITHNSLLADIFDDTWSERTGACVLGYIIVLVCLSLYLCINKSRKSFFEYAMCIFVKYFQIYIVSFVMLIGFALIFGIINILFFPSSDSLWEIYAHICMLIGGMYALPFSVYALVKPETEISRFMEILVKYVMHILSLIAYVIIYIYMIKILVMREIPSNSIFEICTALFVCSMIIAIMCLSFEIKGILQKTAAVLPYIFAPFIILQVYAVTARIRQYGVTPSRYVGVVFIVFEVLYIVLYTICGNSAITADKNTNINSTENDIENNIENASVILTNIDQNKETNITMHLVFVIIAVLTTITVFIPGINVLTASKNSQVKIIKRYISEKELSPSDELVKKAYGAALYIEASDYGENLLNKLLSKDEYKKLSDKRNSLLNIENSVKKEGIIYGSCSINDADISGYNRIYSVSDYDNRWYDEDGPIDLKNLTVTTEAKDGSPICYNLDLSDEFEQYKAAELKNKGTVFSYCDNIVPLSDDVVLYITYLNIRYNEDDGNTIINSLSFDGYVFTR